MKSYKIVLIVLVGFSTPISEYCSMNPNDKKCQPIEAVNCQDPPNPFDNFDVNSISSALTANTTVSGSASTTSQSTFSEMIEL